MKTLLKANQLSSRFITRWIIELLVEKFVLKFKFYFESKLIIGDRRNRFSYAKDGARSLVSKRLKFQTRFSKLTAPQ